MEQEQANATFTTKAIRRLIETLYGTFPPDNFTGSCFLTGPMERTIS